MPSLTVSKIENGTVIDHIPAGNALKILNVVSDSGEDAVISVIMNVDSRTIGRKDILKIEGKEMDPWEIDSVALFAPSATLNVIEGYEVVDKQQLDVPETVAGIIDCPNPDCITNADEPADTVFHVIAENPVELKCRYCESAFGHDDLNLPRF